jgi:hypothetical protein
MAAHTVRNNEELLILHEAEVVLIVGTLHPYISLGSVSDLHGNLRA